MGFTIKSRFFISILTAPYSVLCIKSLCNAFNTTGKPISLDFLTNPNKE